MDIIKKDSNGDSNNYISINSIYCSRIRKKVKKRTTPTLKWCCSLGFDSLSRG